jgi:hypothetical protein
MNNLFATMTLEKLLTYIGVILLIAISIYAVRKIFSQDVDGKKFIKKFKSKKVEILELLLAVMNGIEAFIAASLGSLQVIEVPFATRLGMHLAISAGSAAVGFAFFDQIKEAVLATKELFTAATKGKKLGSAIVIFLKEWLDALMSIGIAIGGPIMNWIVILVGTGNMMIEVIDYYPFISIQIMSGQLQLLALGSTCTVIVHAVIVFYLGMVSFDDIKAEYFTEEKVDTYIPTRDDIKGYVTKHCGVDPAKFEDYLKDNSTKFERLYDLETRFLSARALKKKIDKREGNRDELLNAHKNLTQINQAFQTIFTVTP